MLRETWPEQKFRKGPHAVVFIPIWGDWVSLGIHLCSLSLGLTGHTKPGPIPEVLSGGTLDWGVEEREVQRPDQQEGVVSKGEERSRRGGPSWNLGLPSPQD